MLLTISAKKNRQPVSEKNSFIGNIKTYALNAFKMHRLSLKRRKSCDFALHLKKVKAYSKADKHFPVKAIGFHLVMLLHILTRPHLYKYAIQKQVLIF